VKSKKKNDKITTLEMEVALMYNINIQQYIVVPNVFWTFFRHEVDLLSVTKSGYATEYEIKISKADIKKDKKKWHNHRSQLIKYLYFAVPDYLADFALDHIPERAGLISVSRTNHEHATDKGFYNTQKHRIKVVKKATINSDVKKWTDTQMRKLLEIGVMRIRGLKKKILKLNKSSIVEGN